MGAPLSESHPQLAAQWHPTRNGKLTPERVSAGAKTRVWWQCPKEPDHEWQAAVYTRKAGNGCPFCANRLASKTNSLLSRFPALAAQWHPTLNGQLSPAELTAGSTKRVWWGCPHNPSHQWRAAVLRRTRQGDGCPICSNHQVSKDNSLAVRFPQIAAQWHPTKNGNLRPQQVVASSTKRVWWKCPKGPDHQWQSKIESRTARQSACPFCLGKRVSVTNSLATRFPKIAAQWHPTKNEPLRPEDVTGGTDRQVWWLCAEDPTHEWPALIESRTLLGSGCPYCARRKMSPRLSLSVECPEVAAQWHPTRNGTMSPDEVTGGSNLRPWWKCPEGPDHEWQAPVQRRIRERGCPFCASRKVSVTNSVASLHPQLVAQWHPINNGTLRPEQVVAGSRLKVWWKCPEGPDHQWQAPVRFRAQGSACPYCSGKLVSVTNSLATRFPHIAAQWHPTRNAQLRPEQVNSESPRKVWWQCPQQPQHEWQAAVNHRVRGSRTGCPHCARAHKKAQASRRGRQSVGAVVS